MTGLDFVRISVREAIFYFWVLGLAANYVSYRRRFLAVFCIYIANPHLHQTFPHIPSSSYLWRISRRYPGLELDTASDRFVCCKMQYRNAEFIIITLIYVTRVSRWALGESQLWTSS